MLTIRTGFWVQMVAGEAAFDLLLNSPSVSLLVKQSRSGTDTPLEGWKSDRRACSSGAQQITNCSKPGTSTSQTVFAAHDEPRSPKARESQQHWQKLKVSTT